MKKVFLDTNILVDYFDSSRSEHITAYVLFSKSGEDYSIHCSLKSVMDLYYILGEKKKAKKSVQHLNTVCQIIPATENSLNSALELGNWKDLEDAFQYSIATENQMDFIVTHDRKGFKNAKIPIKSARQVLEMLAPR